MRYDISKKTATVMPALDKVTECPNMVFLYKAHSSHDGRISH